MLVLERAGSSPVLGTSSLFELRSAKSVQKPPTKVGGFFVSSCEQNTGREVYPESKAIREVQFPPLVGRLEPSFEKKQPAVSIII